MPRKPPDERQVYDRSDENREPLGAARAFFLDTYAHERPEVLHQLEPLVRDVAAFKDLPSVWLYLDGADCWLLSEHVQELGPLRERLKHWAVSFGFTSPDGHSAAPWIMDTALSTLGRWAISSKRDGWAHSVAFHREYWEDSTLSEFQLKGRKLRETRPQFEERVRIESRLIAERRLLDDEHEEARRNEQRACWASNVEITRSKVELFAKRLAHPEVILKHLDERAATSSGMANVSRELKEAAEYLGIARPPASTAPRVRAVSARRI